MNDKKDMGKNYYKHWAVDIGRCTTHPTYNNTDECVRGLNDE